MPITYALAIVATVQVRALGHWVAVITRHRAFVNVDTNAVMVLKALVALANESAVNVKAL